MSLIRATQAEFTKHRTTAMWWVMAIVLIVYVGFVAVALAFSLSQAAGGDAPFGSVRPLYGVAASVGYVVPVIIGALMVTNEFRHQTLTPTFLATPKRSMVLWAKVIAGAVLGVFYCVVGVIATVAPGAGILAANDIDPALGEIETWALLGRVILAFVLWVVIGVGLGVLVRNQIAAVVGVLAFTIFIEPILLFVQVSVEGLADILRVLPGAATNTLIGESIYSVGSTGGDDTEWWVGALLLLGYAAVLLLLGSLLNWRRDVN